MGPLSRRIAARLDRLERTAAPPELVGHVVPFTVRGLDPGPDCVPWSEVLTEAEAADRGLYYIPAEDDRPEPEDPDGSLR